MKITALCGLLCAFLAAGTFAAKASPTSSDANAAVAALLSYLKTHDQSDVQNPKCVVIQGWAKCGYVTAHGNIRIGPASGHVVQYLEYVQKTSLWKILGGCGGMTCKSGDLEDGGMPASIADKFAASP